jgi:hypothetical protein
VPGSESNDDDEDRRGASGERGAAENLATSIEQDLCALIEVLDRHLEMATGTPAHLEMAKAIAGQALELAARLSAITARKPN